VVKIIKNGLFVKISILQGVFWTKFPKKACYIRGTFKKRNAYETFVDFGPGGLVRLSLGLHVRERVGGGGIFHAAYCA
jgi:hypothetical protein